MNKFISKKTETKKKRVTKKVAVKQEEPKNEVIKKSGQEFITCPRCGWLHTSDTIKCRFCGKKL